jgi:hypothetical protein
MATANLIPACFICGAPLRVRLTRSQKGKTGVELACPEDGRHQRTFVNHRPFVEEMVVRLAEALAAPTPVDDGNEPSLPNTDPPSAAGPGQRSE